MRFWTRGGSAAARTCVQGSGSLWEVKARGRADELPVRLESVPEPIPFWLGDTPLARHNHARGATSGSHLVDGSWVKSQS